MANEPSGISVWTPKIANESVVRKFISLNGLGYIAISIQQGADPGSVVPVDPDPQSLAIAIWFNDVIANPITNPPYGTQVATVTADSITRTDVGKYYYDVGPALTANRGLLTAVWTYTVSGTAFQFTDHLQILDPMPLYDSLTDSERLVVEQVSWMFGDLYDSTDGGVHLIEEFQTKWDYERIAQMQAIAVQKMNFIGNFGNAPTNWSIGSGASAITVPGRPVTYTQVLPNGATNTITYATQSSTFYNSNSVPANFFGLQVWGTYIECLRHLRDSYTELPQRPGMDAVYTDRTQYQQRWGGTLQTEEPNYIKAVTQAKISLLQLSRGSILVAGGIYGGSALGIFQAGTYASQVRSWRFYPAAAAVMFPATSH